MKRSIDFFLRDVTDELVFEPRTARAKAFIRWNKFPKKCPRGQAAEHVSRLIDQGFNVVGERTA